MRSLLFVVLAILFAIVLAEDAPAPFKGKTIIGIDLGTTYSCVGVYRNGKVEIIPNEQGNRITPSMVSFTDEGFRLIGDAARNQQPLNPRNTFYDVKRLVGRTYSEILRDASLLTYDIVNQNGKPYIKGIINGKEKLFAPEEISAMVLGKMKEIAEKYLGETVEYAVITVPAYFNDAQRQATKDAGAIAGLEVVRIINEPTAASMAYGLNKTEENILVFDLGGGTHDVTLLTIADDVFEVKATNGDTHLGGEDFDHKILEHFMKIFKAKNGKDMSLNKRAVAKLKQAVEAAKRTLSSQVEARIEIESLHDGIDFSEPFTRAKFEELNMDLFKKTLKPVENVLADSKLNKDEIDEVVIVGGSTRIPKIRELLSDYFGGKELHKEINPDEAIAYGATVQAAALAGVLKDVVLIDVTPLTLGFETVGGVMTKMIPRNSKIPVEKADIFTTVEDYQTTLVVDVYEGERSLTKYNRLLGSFELKDIPPARASIPQIEVKFSLDQNGILTVTAKDLKTGKSEKIQIQKGTLDASEVERFTEDAKLYAEEDKKALERVSAKNELDLLIQNSRTRADELKDKLSESDKQRIEDALDKVTDWTFDNQEADPRDWKRKTHDLERLVDPIFRKHKIGAAADDEDKKDEL